VKAYVDANILLRLLTGEPKDLADRAEGLLRRAELKGLEIVLTPIVLAEVVYVLEGQYGWAREEIADGLEEIVSDSVVRVVEQAVAIRALALYRQHRRLDFADAYLGAIVESRSDSVALSFDRDLGRIPSITVISESKQLEA